MKIKTKITLLILGTAVLLLPVVSGVYYSKVKETFLNETYEHLEAVSETKKIRLKDIIQKRYDLISLLSTNPILISYFKENKNNSSLDTTISAIINRYSSHIRTFSEINILSLNGVVVSSSKANNVGEDYSKHPFVNNAIHGKIQWGDFHLNDVGKLSTYIASPIFLDDKILGIVLIESDAEDILSLTSDYTGLGETGETVIGLKIEDSTLLINSLRFHTGEPIKRKMDPANSTIPMNIAISGYEGILHEGIDYRNEKVIASTRYIPEVQWGIVTKLIRMKLTNLSES